MERDWLTSTPYDESFPFSHLYGYTGVNTTSIESIQIWKRTGNQPLNSPHGSRKSTVVLKEKWESAVGFLAITRSSGRCQRPSTRIFLLFPSSI